MRLLAVGSMSTFGFLGSLSGDVKSIGEGMSAHLSTALFRSFRDFGENTAVVEWEIKHCKETEGMVRVCKHEQQP